MAGAGQASPVVRYSVIALGVVVLGLGLATLRRDGRHPDPRADLSTVVVAPADRYASYPEVAQVYAMAAEIPHVLDGLYCHCDCSRHSGHRSLLDCFRDDHGAGCDICLHEAAIAYQLTLEGRSLKEIRRAIDAEYSS